MMNWKPKVWILIIGLFVTLGIITAYSLYNKPHRQASNEVPAMEVQAVQLYNRYVSDEGGADSLYLDKVLQVYGVVEEILTNEHGEKVLMLETPELFDVSCTMDSTQKNKLQEIKIGDEVAIKGLCHGMLMDVVLVECILIDK
jgi:hypothetical protein